ncbi:RNA polymerase sigma factor (sigma-70 family) [Cryobacterium sp. CAN_C3]|uniref:RNA polymerase sigma factor n=1 Tax=unclassified Cryobacterium TaxID=2649013 RepID=UPI001A19B326|nr:RNA polymerase sigma factor (sigma-70 family) [Cryobacterium sp. CAN_C3]
MGIVNELELWTRACADDGRAFALLFDEHRDRVFRHCLRLVDNPHDAEEVTATSFLELWRRRNGIILVNGSVVPWLLVTASNVARNVRRGTRRHRALLDALPRTADARDYEQRTPVDIADQGADNALTREIKLLSQTDAALIVLVTLEDYQITDAAALLGLSAGAARTRLHRAKTKLRERLPQLVKEMP